MTTRHWSINHAAARLAAVVVLAVLAATGCNSADGETRTEATVAADPESDTAQPESDTAQPESDTATQEPSTTTSGPEQISPATSVSEEPVLATPCFVTGPDLVLPQDWDWIAA
ncbi:MAG: hypothetical protein ACR2QK_21140, partial [Acidimicrobiales bacterium]